MILYLKYFANMFEMLLYYYFPETILKSVKGLKYLKRLPAHPHLLASLVFLSGFCIFLNPFQVLVKHLL